MFVIIEVVNVVRAPVVSLPACTMRMERLLFGNGVVSHTSFGNDVARLGEGKFDPVIRSEFVLLASGVLEDVSHALGACCWVDHSYVKCTKSISNQFWRTCF